MALGINEFFEPFCPAKGINSKSLDDGKFSKTVNEECV